MYKVQEKCDGKRSCKVTVKAAEMGGLVSQCSGNTPLRLGVVQQWHHRFLDDFSPNMRPVLPTPLTPLTPHIIHWQMSFQTGRSLSTDCTWAMTVRGTRTGQRSGRAATHVQVQLQLQQHHHQQQLQLQQQWTQLSALWRFPLTVLMTQGPAAICNQKLEWTGIKLER